LGSLRGNKGNNLSQQTSAEDGNAIIDDRRGLVEIVTVEAPATVPG
jgi:hypothetical protein